MPRSAAPASTYVGTSEGRIVTIPTSENSSRRSLSRTTPVSTPSASRRSRVPPINAPRGTARVRPFKPIARPVRPRPRGRSCPPLPARALSDEGDVQPFDVERPPARRQLPPEPREQVVVAPSPAQRHADRAVVDLVDRARVIAQRP